MTNQNQEFFKQLAQSGGDLMKRSDSLDIAINNLYEKMTMFITPISYRVEAERARFRGSDLPFCPLKFMLDNVRDRPRYEEVTFMSDFYTTGGDAFHMSLQRWLGATGHMWGKFKCRKCGKLYPEGCDEEDNKLMAGPVYCCGELAYYHELHVRDDVFSGHLDGLQHYHDAFLPSEFKQMGQRIFQRRLANGYDMHHYYQIQAYRRILPHWMGLDEKAFHPFVLLWYFERGDCRVNKRWLLKYDPTVYDRQLALVLQTKRYIEKKQYRKCHGICKSQTDNPHCPYNQMVCFASVDQRERIIDLLISH